MPKYDFPGIKRAGALALEAALATTSWGAYLLASPFIKFFSPVKDWIVEWVVNWLANKGLVVLNLTAIYVNGEFDQAAFDNAIDDALKKVGGPVRLKPEEGKALDDAVINAADKFIDFGSVQPDADTGLQSGSNPPV